MGTSYSPGHEELQIVESLLGDPLGWHLGLTISAAAKIAAGAAYPALARLEKAGWLESRWDEAPAGGLRRRRYRLTGLGQQLGSTQLVDRPGEMKKRSRFGFAARRESFA